MKWFAAFVDRLSSLKALGTPACGQSYPPTSASISGPARIAYQSPRIDGELPLPARRMALILESRRARDLRQSKLAALIEKDLRAVNHQMLAIYLERKRHD